MAMYPDTRSCTPFNSCTLTVVWPRQSLYRDTAPVPATSFVTGDSFLALIWHCIATRLYLTNSLHEGKKYAIPSLHRDSSLPKVPGSARMLASGNTTSLYCRPLAQMGCADFELAHPRTQQTFILTDIDLAHIFETPSRNVTLDSFIVI